MAAVSFTTAAAPAAAKDVRGERGKLASPLPGLVATEQAGRDPQSFGEPRDLDVSGGGRVAVDVHLRTDDVPGVSAALQDLGMTVRVRTYRAPLPVIEGWLPIDRLEQAAGVAGVQAILPVTGAGTDVGLKLSEGDAAHRAPQARALGGGITGAGVPVGVISDSMNKVGGGIADSVANGELPADTAVITDGGGAPLEPTGGSDEGRAMAEIIYDEAPGIPKIRFGSGSLGAATKADVINRLVAGGAKVIADDIFYMSEPFFQDGVVSQAVDAAKAAGVMYFASAGNRGRQSWEGTVNAAIGGYQDFGGTIPTEPTQQTVSTNVPNGARIQVGVQWKEPWNGATTDLDAFLVDAGTGTVLASSETDNIQTHNPAEIVTWTNAGAPTAVALKLLRFAGGTPFVKTIVFGSGAGVSIENPTNSDAINSDAAAAAGAYAVAAIDALDPGLDSPEDFSSRGPKTRYFDKDGKPLAQPEVRQKPQLAAADGVATSVPNFDPFIGTSAATPSAAGVAALVRSANPALSVDDVGALMMNPLRSNHCTGGALPDLDCGFGFVFADAAVGQALDTTKPVVTAVLSRVPNAKGWTTSDASVTWTVSEPDSVVLSRTGCTPVSRTTDGVTSVSCSARSVPGTTTQTLSLKVDKTPPAAPTFAGIADGVTLQPDQLPSAVACQSSDPTSGVDTCVVTGLDAALGDHTLNATATDNAGLKSTSTLTYHVVSPPPAGPPGAEQPLAPVVPNLPLAAVTKKKPSTSTKAKPKTKRVCKVVRKRGKKVRVCKTVVVKRKPAAKKKAPAKKAPAKKATTKRP